MPKFRKRPVVIEAEQYLPRSGMIPAGISGVSPNKLCGCVLVGSPYASIPHVHTMRNGGLSVVVVEDGDWIIPEPDSKGFYPVKPDVFANTYEPMP